jgi:hypothetical protein
MAETMGLQLRFFDPKAGDGKGLEFTAPDHSKTSIRLVYDPATYRLKSNSICIDLPEEHGRGYPFNKMYLEVSYSNYQEINGKFPYRLDDFVKRAGKNDYRPVEGYGKYVVMF